MSQAISDICRQIRISDYLAARGVVLHRAGSRIKCCCPLHNERTPSFYITVKPDGTEQFKCFGCEKWGSIIGLMSEMEGKDRGHVIRNLALRLNLKLEKFDEADSREPLSDEILDYFCIEDELQLEVADYVVPFLAKNPTADVVNKISRAYETIDTRASHGDAEGVMRGIMEIIKVTTEYVAMEA